MPSRGSAAARLGPGELENDQMVDDYTGKFKQGSIRVAGSLTVHTDRG